MPTNLRGREPRECRVEFRLSVSELEALELAAFDEDIPVSHVIRAALRRYIEEKGHRDERRARRQ